MAKNSTPADERPREDAAAVVTPQVQPKRDGQTEYTAEEFAAAAGVIFGGNVSPDCVTAAFRLAGITRATKEKAREIVTNFTKREVK